MPGSLGEFELEANYEAVRSMWRTKLRRGQRGLDLHAGAGMCRTQLRSIGGKTTGGCPLQYPDKNPQDDLEEIH